MIQLHELSKRFLSAADIDAIVRGVFEAVTQARAASAITFRLRNENTGEFEPIACRNLDLEEWRSASPRGGVGLSKMVIDGKRPVPLLDLQNQANVQNAPFLKKHGLVSYLGIPILVREQVIGVVGYYSKNVNGFDAEKIEFLTMVTDLASLAAGYAIPMAGVADNTLETETPGTHLDSSERAKAEFLNVMSHEFRTPLSLIMGHAGMIREGLLGDVSEEQKSSLDRIMENSDSLLAMVMSILHASRIESGGVQLIARKILIHDLFDELKAAYGQHANEQRKIVWYCSPDLQLLRSDPERLKDILRQLIDNAIKFTFRGRIVVSAEKVDNLASIQFAVADTGVGIAAEGLPYVFERFRQSDSSGTRPFEGAGLGLYIAKKYSELLGGELSVTSETGKGSTFTLMMPIGG